VYAQGTVSLQLVNHLDQPIGREMSEISQGLQGFFPTKERSKWFKTNQDYGTETSIAEDAQNRLTSGSASPCRVF
jgi:hypothetical protein